MTHKPGHKAKKPRKRRTDRCDYCEPPRGRGSRKGFLPLIPIAAAVLIGGIGLWITGQAANQLVLPIGKIGAAVIGLMIAYVGFRYAASHKPIKPKDLGVAVLVALLGFIVLAFGMFALNVVPV